MEDEQITMLAIQGIVNAETIPAKRRLEALLELLQNEHHVE